MDDPSSSRLRVLIVEDDQVTALDLEKTLVRRGFLVVGTAHTAERALELAASEKPEIALLDIRLDNADEGIRIASVLREERNVPVIFVTGYSEEALFEQAREARPAGFVRKPFSDAELAACLEAVAERDAAGENLSRRISGIEAVAAQIPEAVVVANLEGEVVYLNETAEELSGRSRAEAAGLQLGEVLHLEAREDAPDPDEPESERIIFLRTSGGEILPLRERTAAIRSDEGDVVGLVMTLSAPHSDETPEPEPSREDAEPAGKPATPDDSTPATPDEDGEREFHPPARRGALRKIAELSRDPAFRELIGKRDRPPGPGGKKEIAPAHPAPEQDPTPGTEAKPAPPVTGAGPVFAAAGSPLLEDVGDPLLKVDGNGRIRFANSEAISVFGGGRDLVGLSFWDRFTSEEFENYDESFRRPLVDGRRHRFEFHDTRRGKWFEVRVYPSEDGALSLFSDVTEAKMKSSENLRQQRLEGLGLLARGFAHDFNNHLTTLTGNISLARERHQDDADLQQMLAEAQAAASRATGLVQQLMTFARGGRPIRKRTRISDLVRRVLTEQRIQHPDIRYQFQGADRELVGNVDPAQVSRLVENLVNNSVVAMLDGGVLIVRTARLSPGEVVAIRGSHDPADEDHLLIEVIDTGHGMSEASLGRVFEPYFTTRKKDNASGIGLTVCESIAKAHGGFVQLQSKEGKGTIATFCAPLGIHTIDGEEAPFDAADLSEPELKPLAPIAVEQSREEDGGGNLLVGTRILILEDDAPIRRLMAATLRRAGHEVVETKDGRETVAAYRESMEQGAKYHLLICDLTIENGMGGVETMRRLLEIDPAVLAIVSSGYSDAPAMSSPAAFGFKGVLPKPYAPTELRAAVHRILTAHHIIS